MTRRIYVILLVTPFILAGALFKNAPTDIFPWMAGMYVPLISIIRMKHIMTWKEIFKSIISLNPMEKFKIFQKDIKK